MSHELFYTSAPKGLLPGTRGYCTVACTKGMPTSLSEKVESLSGYRPLFPPHDRKASLNPVNYGHVQISIGGRTYHVLSRISSAGLDYTDRTNKFAHHVVLEAHELTPAGPAWALRQPGFIETQWDGETRYLPTGRVPTVTDAPPGPCREWQRLAGDAGWAGVVAESFLRNPDRPVYFIFEPGMDLLPLVAEAIALVPPSERWRVTFNTYLSGLPGGLTCAWRGVAKNSDDATTARQLPGALVIDLAGKLSAPPLGPSVDAARAGKVMGLADGANVPVAVAVPVGAAAPGDRRGHGSPPSLPTADKKAAALRAAAPPPPPLPAARTETTPNRNGGRSKVSFGVGMVAGILTSLIPLGALVATGMILIPAAGFGPKEPNTSETALVTLKEPTSPTIETTPRIEVKNKDKHFQMIEELSDAKQRLESELKKEKETGEKTKGMLNQARTQLEQFKASNEKLKTEVQRKDLEIENTSETIARLTKENATQKAPPKLISLQFDFKKSELNNKDWTFPEKPTDMRLYPLEKRVKDVPVKRDKGADLLDVEQHFSDSRLTIMLIGKVLPNKNKPTPLAHLECVDGRLKFRWEDSTANLDTVKDIKRRLEDILPYQYLEIKSASRTEPDRISLRRSQRGRPAEGGLSISDFEKIVDDIARPYPDLKDYDRTIPIEWESRLWTNVVKTDKAKKGDSKQHRLVPAPGAAIYMRVDDGWLIELCHWN